MKPIFLNDRALLFVESQNPLTIADCSIDEGTRDRIWHQLCDKNPNRFNGPLSHVVSIEESAEAVTMHVAPSEYRLAAVQTKLQDDAESLGRPRGDGNIGIHPLGVKGITSRDGKVLMGKRSMRVGVYENMWEFAPGGGVEPGDDPLKRLVEELHEETGLAPGGELVATAIVLDEVLGTFEIIYSLNSTHGTISPSPEYAKVKWCCPDDLPQPLSPLATQMAELL